jgi:hypothetical protein
MATVSSSGARAHGRRPLVAMAVVTCVAALASCSSDEPDRSLGGYCEQIAANIGAINAPQIASPDDIVTTLELYRTIGERAPAAVEPEWQTMIDSLETAATVIAGDAASVAVANEVALSSQSAATRIQQYTKQSCGTDIGTPPPPTNPVTATTVSPPATT